MSLWALGVVLKYFPKLAGMEGFLLRELEVELELKSGIDGLLPRELVSEREAAAAFLRVGEMLVKSRFGGVEFSFGVGLLRLGDEDAMVGDAKV